MKPTSVSLSSLPARWLTTNAPGFHGPNNCGPTCALNALEIWTSLRDPLRESVYFRDPAALHERLFRHMGVGKMGAHALKYRTGICAVYKELGIALEARVSLWVTAGQIQKELSQGRPIALCLLRDKKYGWHWVLGVGLKHENGHWMVRIVDGWQQELVWVPLHSSQRLGMHAVRLVPGVRTQAQARQTELA